MEASVSECLHFQKLTILITEYWLLSFHRKKKGHQMGEKAELGKEKHNKSLQRVISWERLWSRLPAPAVGLSAQCSWAAALGISTSIFDSVLVDKN